MCAYMATAAFGVKRNRRLLKYLLKTDLNFGTFQKNIIRALRKFKFRCSVVSFANDMPTEAGVKKLLSKYFKNGYLGIACVDDNEHWIIVRGIRKSRVYIADPEIQAPKYHTLSNFYKRVKLGSIIFVKGK